MKQNLSESGNKAQVTILGKGTVGKSSFTYSIMNYEISRDHDPTIEDKYKTVIEVDNLPYEVEILDTAGQDDFQSMLDSWINFGQGFVLIFSLNDKESFEALDKRRNRILAIKKTKVPIILVGNKSDLEKERVISTEVGNQKAKEWGVQYFETSAKVKK